jgi:hypothetical protein
VIDSPPPLAAFLARNCSAVPPAWLTVGVAQPLASFAAPGNLSTGLE